MHFLQTSHSEYMKNLRQDHVRSAMTPEFPKLHLHLNRSHHLIEIKVKKLFPFAIPPQLQILQYIICRIPGASSALSPALVHRKQEHLDNVSESIEADHRHAPESPAQG